MEDSVQLSSRFGISGEWMVSEAQSYHKKISRSDTIFCYCCFVFFFFFELGIVTLMQVNLSLISTKICRIFSYEAFSWINWEVSPRLWASKIEFPSNWLGKCWGFFYQCSLLFGLLFTGPYLLSLGSSSQQIRGATNYNSLWKSPIEFYGVKWDWAHLQPVIFSLIEPFR